jgi:phage I-like protein
MAEAQEKPKVFVQPQAGAAGGSGKFLGMLGSKSGAEPQDQASELSKGLQMDCSSMQLSSEQASADYSIVLSMPANLSKKNRSVRANGQVQVANRAGRIIGTNFMHTSGNAVKDACELIDADWQGRGSVAPPDPVLVPGVTMPPESGASVPASGAATSTSAGLETGSHTSVAAGGSAVDGETMGAASRRARQHAACLKQAKENPSITCK